MNKIILSLASFSFLIFSNYASADDIYFYSCAYGSVSQSGYIAGEYRMQAIQECHALGGSYADHKVAIE